MLGFDLLHQLHVEEAGPFPVLVVEPVVTVGLEAHDPAADDGVHRGHVQFIVSHVGDLHVVNRRVGLVQAFGDDLLAHPAVVVEGRPLRALHEQLGVVRGQGHTDRTDLTDRDVRLLGPHAVPLAVGDVHTPFVHHRHTEADGRRFARDGGQLNPVDLVVTHGVLDHFHVVPGDGDAGFLHAHHGVQHVALHHLLDVLTVHLLDGRLAHRLVTHRIHLRVVVRLLQGEVFERDLQGLLDGLRLVPRVVHGLVRFGQALHSAVLRCREQVLVHQLVDLRLDGAGQGVADVGRAHDLDVRGAVLTAGLDDQLTVLVRHLRITAALSRFVQLRCQFFFLVHQQLVRTRFRQQLFLLGLFFVGLGSLFLSLRVAHLLGLLLHRGCHERVGLVDHLGQQFQEP
ncbi:hypothetical protein D3C73_799820 [compost metagenome]